MPAETFIGDLLQPLFRSANKFFPIDNSVQTDKNIFSQKKVIYPWKYLAFSCEEISRADN